VEPAAVEKTNQSLVGGRVIDSPRIYALTVHNEPQNRKPSAHPGMDTPVAQRVKLIAALGPKRHRAGFRARILGYDHNWTMHPNDVATTPPGGDPETAYPTKLLLTKAARWIDGTAFHCYSGDMSRRPSSSTRSRARACGSPSAPARTARPTRRRKCSPTPSSGTRATTCSASPATGQDRRQLEPGAAPRRQPAQRRLRHLHRRDQRRRRSMEPERRVRVDGALDDGDRLLDPPRGPAEAVDDDATATWTGDALELDLGRPQPVRRLVLDPARYLRVVFDAPATVADARVSR
jgi:hypothetical protein